MNVITEYLYFHPKFLNFFANLIWPNMISNTNFKGQNLVFTVEEAISNCNVLHNIHDIFKSSIST